MSQLPCLALAALSIFCAAHSNAAITVKMLPPATTGVNEQPVSTRSISVDGQVVACMTDMGRLALWREGTGLQVLPWPGSNEPQPNPLSVGTRLSPNGQRMFAFGYWLSTGDAFDYVWTAETGFVNRPNGISGPVVAIADSGMLVGSTNIAGQRRAATWTPDLTTVLNPINGFSTSTAAAANADFSRIVGNSSNPGLLSRATAWNNGVTEDIGMLPGHTSSAALAASPSGEWVAGVSSGSNDRAGFLHHPSAGMLALVSPVPGPGLQPTAVADDGTVVGVGWGWGSFPFIRLPDGSTHNLNEYLAEAIWSDVGGGTLDPSEWWISLNSISADGKTAAGTASAINGWNSRAVVINLPSPAAGMLFIVFAGAYRPRRRMRAA